MIDSLLAAVVVHSLLLAEVALVSVGVLNTFGKELLWVWVRFRFATVGLSRTAHLNGIIGRPLLAWRASSRG